VADLEPGIRSSWPYPLLGYGQHLFFMGKQAESGNELWITDGTEAGTRLVQDICPGPCSSWPVWGAISGGRLIFSACHPDFGCEPWILDPKVVSTEAPASGSVSLLDARLMPNPAENSTVLQVRLPLAAPTLIRMFDANGRLARSFQQHLEAGDNARIIPLQGLPGGWYFLSIDAGAAGSQTIRLLIQGSE
jgi:ELWxxDGT repeat protein